MKKALGTLAMWGWFLMGLVQIAAMVDGVKAFLGINTFFAACISVIVSYIPLLGSIAGVSGAINAWHWHWLAAILLFFWPYALMLVATMIDAATDR